MYNPDEILVWQKFPLATTGKYRDSMSANSVHLIVTHQAEEHQEPLPACTQLFVYICGSLVTRLVSAKLMAQSQSTCLSASRYY